MAHLHGHGNSMTELAQLGQFSVNFITKFARDIWNWLVSAVWCQGHLGYSYYSFKLFWMAFSNVHLQCYCSSDTFLTIQSLDSVLNRNYRSPCYKLHTCGKFSNYWLPCTTSNYHQALSLAGLQFCCATGGGSGVWCWIQDSTGQYADWVAVVQLVWHSWFVRDQSRGFWSITRSFQETWNLK